MRAPSITEDVAARVGVSISLISKYKNNKLLPRLTVPHALMTALSTNIGALFDADWNGVDHVARAGTRPCIAAGGGGMRWA